MMSFHLRMRDANSNIYIYILHPVIKLDRIPVSVIKRNGDNKKCQKCFDLLIVYIIVKTRIKLGLTASTISSRKDLCIRANMPAITDFLMLEKGHLSILL